MERVQDILTILNDLSTPERAEITKRFFKIGVGSYSENDQFIGVRVPELRILAKNSMDLTIDEVSYIIQSPIHEQRHLALLIWTLQYQSTRTSEAEKQQIYEAYIEHRHWINNWDLIDSTAPHVVGEHLRTRCREILYRWAESPSLWERRMSIVSTWAFIKHGDLDDTISIATILLEDTEDLIHKSVGWMLRELGKRDVERLHNFLNIHHTSMPRTMLRYSIERLSQDQKTLYMKRR